MKRQQILFVITEKYRPGTQKFPVKVEDFLFRQDFLYALVPVHGFVAAGTFIGTATAFTQFIAQKRAGRSARTAKRLPGKNVPDIEQHEGNTHDCCDQEEYVQKGHWLVLLPNNAPQE